MGTPHGSSCEAVNVIIATRLENIREAEVGTIALQKFAIDTFPGRGQDRSAPSCLGVLPKELHPTCFPQGNLSEMASLAQLKVIFMKEITNIIYSTFAVVALACFALLPKAQAVSPPPDGGYPGDNTAEGDNALLNLTSGLDNTAIGSQALLNNSTGNYNTATGFQALFSNTTGTDNTATGYVALFSNTTGTSNTAVGFAALDFNTTGSVNTAIGTHALDLNTTGNDNTATGGGALERNTTGSNNTANGALALETNAIGSFNTAIGEGALDGNHGGSNNTATGFQALFSNINGSNNTANGVDALMNNAADFNTATGFNALSNNTTGHNNIALGFNAGGNLTTGSNNINIGALGVAGDAKKIRIGTLGTQTATFVAGIAGVTVPSGVGVIVGSNGQLGTVVSSERFKDEVKPMDKASEAILALKPVTFRYKHELDPDGIPQFGLVAEEVEKVNSALVARDADGKPYTVRYEAVNAMLLNEFLKEHKAFVAEQRKVEKLEAAVADLVTTVKEQAAQIQKVSAQLGASKLAPQVVANDQ
jgi:hypothetical protein